MNIHTALSSQSQAQLAPFSGQWQKKSAAPRKRQLFHGKKDTFRKNLDRAIETCGLQAATLISLISISSEFTDPSVVHGQQCFRIRCDDIANFSICKMSRYQIHRAKHRLLREGVLREVDRRKYGAREDVRYTFDEVILYEKTGLFFITNDEVSIAKTQPQPLQNRNGSHCENATGNLNNISNLQPLRETKRETVRETPSNVSHCEDVRAGANESQNLEIPIFENGQNNWYIPEHYDPHNPPIQRPKLGLVEELKKRRSRDGGLQAGCTISGESSGANQDVSNANGIVTDSDGGRQCTKTSVDMEYHSTNNEQLRLPDVRGNGTDEVASVSSKGTERVVNGPGGMEDSSNALSTRKIEGNRESNENFIEISGYPQFETSSTPYPEESPTILQSGDCLDVERKRRINGGDTSGRDGSTNQGESDMQGVRRVRMAGNNDDDHQSKGGRWQERGICPGGGTLRTQSESAAIPQGESLSLEDEWWPPSLNPGRSARKGWSKRITRWKV